MTAFWALGALLAAAALAWALRPLWRAGARDGASREALNAAVYRDQLRELEADRAAGVLAPPEYERSRRELERRVLQDAAAEAAPPVERRPGRRVAAALSIALPLAAAGIYLVAGNPGAVSPPSAESPGVTLRQIEAMVARLEARMRETPDDLEGWKMLGRSYRVLGRFGDAAKAYAKAAARAPRDAQLLADFADALGMAQGRSLAGEPEKLVARALEIDPENLKALALAGTAAFHRKDFAAAAAYWERMLPLVPRDSEDARDIEANVREARAMAGESTGGKAAPAASLRGVVKLAPALAARAAPDDTVFIFARAAGGPPMPLAVLRRKVRDLPAEFALDDSLAMTPALKLSAHPRVTVGARVSRSGSATRQPGDLQGASAVVANNASGVTVVIDTVAP